MYNELELLTITKLLQVIIVRHQLKGGQKLCWNECIYICKEVLNSAVLEYCKNKADNLTDDHKRSIWHFIRANFEDSPRTEILNLIGYNNEDVNSILNNHVDDISNNTVNEIKNLNIEKTALPYSIKTGNGTPLSAFNLFFVIILISRFRRFDSPSHSTWKYWSCCWPVPESKTFCRRFNHSDVRRFRAACKDPDKVSAAEWQLRFVANRGTRLTRLVFGDKWLWYRELEGGPCRHSHALDWCQFSITMW